MFELIVLREQVRSFKLDWDEMKLQFNCDNQQKLIREAQRKKMGSNKKEMYIKLCGRIVKSQF